MTIEFENNANQSSVEVNSIINAMVHTKKESARRFLTVMNNIVDYYMNRKSDENEICYPIIYIPHAPEWAKEVWLNFLIIKNALYYNNDCRQLLRDLISPNHIPILRTPEDEKYYKKYVWPRNKYIKSVLCEISDLFISDDGHKNMIICSEKDMHVSRENKNLFISEFYGETDDVFTNKNLIMCHNLDADDIREQLREHRRDDEYVMVDNLFVFYTNNDKVNSLEESSLERWNTAYKMGLKNCFRQLQLKNMNC